MIYDWLFVAEGLNDWFYEDRAAHFASCQLPLIVALAGKNNVISCKQSHTPSVTHDVQRSAVLIGVSHAKVSANARR